ncbi:MAG TPA: hypothetical protein VEX63_06355, partial [Flavisolibacter sp.]|nr:hypothetical protein [Flavisolibacter sp.]
DEVALLPKKLQMLEHDIATLTAIVKGEIETRSFDIDGRKCNIDEAKQVLAQLEQEKESLSDALIQTDQMLFRYFYATAPLAEAEALKRAYVLHFSQCNDAEEYLTAADKMMNSLAPLFRGETLKVETINEMISNLKATYEPGYKEVLKKWKERKVFDRDAGLAEKVNKFLTNDYAYFYESSFMENELSDLNEVVQQAWSCISDHLFVQFKSITEKQAAIAEKKEHKSDVISTVYN